MYNISMQVGIPYLEYFGLSEKPFGMTPDPAFYYESKQHREALDCLTFFLAQREGFALIYGDVGSGKTTLSRIFIDSLGNKTYNTALILNPIMDEAEFIKEVLKELNVQNEQNTKKELYDTLKAFLLDEFANGKETVLIIDEAQLISNELLELIRLISNIETDKQKILHTIFFAQPEFIEKLRDKSMRHLSQRITVTYYIAPLSYSEVRSYIGYRLIKAGMKSNFDIKDNAVKLIHTASRGYPRLINYLCDRCLLLLYAQSKNVIDKRAVSKVLQEENIPLSSVRKKQEVNRSIMEIVFIMLNFFLILFILNLLGIL
jgi:general secretion pathway protein A